MGRTPGNTTAELLTKHYATPNKLSAEYLTGLVTDQGEPEARRTLP